MKNFSSVFCGLAISALSLCSCEEIMNQSRLGLQEQVYELQHQVDSLTLLLSQQQASSEIQDPQDGDYMPVILPDESYVLRGGKYHAKILLVKPLPESCYTVLVNKKKIDNNEYSFTCGSVGRNRYSVNITLNDDNTEGKREFNLDEEYTVGEPMVYFETELSRILYAREEQTIEVSVPGINDNDITLSASNAVLTKDKNKWKVKPLKVGKCAIIVSVNMAGRVCLLTRKEFDVVQK